MDARPDRVTHWEGPGLDAWEPWTPGEAARTLEGLAVPWCVVGGWAIDLFVGEQTRPHDDLEIAVLRDDLGAVRDALPGFEIYTVGDGEVGRLGPWERPSPDKHQNWVLDPGRQRWRVDVMLEPGDRDTWVFRRHQGICAERSLMVRRSSEGVPYLAPVGALLYKAKALRSKDRADFDRCLPLLSALERAWLVDALDVVHPGHVWIDDLG